MNSRRELGSRAEDWEMEGDGDDQSDGMRR